MPTQSTRSRERIEASRKACGGAEVFSPRRRGAQLCQEYRDFSGLLLPTHRRAIPHWPGGRPVHGSPSLMEARIEEVELIKE